MQCVNGVCGSNVVCEWSVCRYLQPVVTHCDCQQQFTKIQQYTPLAHTGRAERVTRRSNAGRLICQWFRQVNRVLEVFGKNRKISPVSSLPVNHSIYNGNSLIKSIKFTEI